MKRLILNADNITDTVRALVQRYFNNNTHNPFYAGRDNIVYFDGWDGIGASAVLTAVSNSPRSKEFNFDRVIHITLSKSEGRRSLQRRIAEQLKLGKSVMDNFDKQDEDDGFSGLDKNARHEIPQVADHILQVLIKERFLVIFHNGSDDEIDLVPFGIPLFDFLENKAVWTHQGRFRIDSSKFKESVKNAHAFFYAWPQQGDLSDTAITSLVHEDEAADLAYYANILGIQPGIVKGCWYYLSWLHYNYGNSIDCDMGTHAPNYWVCDGIIEGGEGSWEAARKLSQAVRFDNLPSKESNIRWFRHFPSLQESRSTWITKTSDDLQTMPRDATSIFIALQNKSALPNNLFQESSSGQVRVLKLSSCAFSFSSPPFLCCFNLRFLWIDRCSDNGLAHELVEKQEKRWISLKGLWVLDIRHTNWAWILTPQIIELMTELKELNVRAASAARTIMKWPRNLQKLRIVESPMFLKVNLLQESSIEIENLELLDLSGNNEMKALPNLSALDRLKVLILDGCDGLGFMQPDVLPASLESFSFDGFGPALQWKHSLQIPETEERPSAREIGQELPGVTKISLQGLTRLKNVFLRGLPDLKELNLSDTGVEALDLEAMQVKQLERLFLLDCEKLRRVQWSDINNPPLKLLCVDTRGKEKRLLDDDGHQGSQQDTTCPLVHIVVKDARFFRGFMFGDPPDFDNLIADQRFHLHLSSTVCHAQVKEIENQNDIICSRDESSGPAGGSSFPYVDVLNNMVGQGDVEGDGCLMQEIVPLVPSQHHIEISEGGSNLEAIRDPDDRNVDLLLMAAESLHVHDHSSITAASIFKTIVQFECMRWCMIDRCPKMHTVFSYIHREAMDLLSFKSLEILKASHLREVQGIWSKGIMFNEYISPLILAFGKLRYIHINSCPSLKFVLPLSFATLPSLEIIHIMHCGELRQIFPTGEAYRGKRATSIQFSRLKHIHLHELPMLQHICETNMLAPALETIKLRCCWSLRRLPAIHSGRGNDKPPAVVDCEKDWWDKLQWDGLEESRSLFTPRHSRHYKIKMLRGSPLR